ncbi:anti-phage defense-associated sirtuin Dsr1 [Silvimonas amylolytica]|uniref:SIR2-like domain-containing protein n=1 Tax=Silvimonas amylolytica TaxID=449663 RepID=A0ABQ2PS86_9NEIS|nr:anti-phage defense-associated sirtuin Dsr1 [Silvimonas amylolytica]GGP28118.1 hypothetical protein GCM10010971_39370 [Silvimonas amylolytica]
MQFIANGPDIPDELLQAHEDGRVVFFCGAGISYPAGLPGFGGLVEAIYKLTGTTFKPIESEAFKRGQFDATLDLLERRLPEQRLGMRRALAERLKPNLRLKGATDTHAALLRLARVGTSLRLVTTNFDHLFHAAAKRTKQAFQTYSAPMLPIPKKSRWDGVVYLHGLLGDKADDVALNRLVVTSGDFGLAYLTERWASRFVSELFRNYVVCFVGYSINDPVLRYMMDALAADRMQGETTPEAWAFGDCNPGQESEKKIEWEAKGVTPVLYEVPTASHDHSALHKTLQAWAETHQNGVLGKEQIVVNHALARPSASSKQDDYVGRMLWAIADKTGLPAQRFAELNPAPSLDWFLEAFTQDRFRHADLVRFGVTPDASVDDKLKFSLVHRPSSYSAAPYMSLVSRMANAPRWDNVMFHLARWLLRHLNDHRLLIWVAQQGAQLPDHWINMIEFQFGKILKLENEGKVAELAEIREQAPNAIPNQIMRSLWRLFLCGRIKSTAYSPDIYRWKERLKRDGLTTTLRLEFREVLAPKLTIRAPFRLVEEQDSSSEPGRLRHLVDWELVLNADHVKVTLFDSADAGWADALPALLDDIELLLRDALDLLHELNEADEFQDRSHWDLPSISSHWQNRDFREWVCLIELLRDAWLHVLEENLARAQSVASGWFEVPYPTFKRLALFAASQDNCIAATTWSGWLLRDTAKWLWDGQTQREVMRLLVLQGKHLFQADQEALEQAILAGPPRDMFVSDLEEDRWQHIKDSTIWLRLAKLQQGGVVLGGASSAYLDAITVENPEWKLTENEREEFSTWMSGTGDPDYVQEIDLVVTPTKRGPLVAWLQQTRSGNRPFYQDTWRQVCRNHFCNSLAALCDLGRQGIWPAGRWGEALYAWGEYRPALRRWLSVAQVLSQMPSEVLVECAHAVTWWVMAVSKTIKKPEHEFLKLCEKLLTFQFAADSTMTTNGQPIDKPVTEALNHPIGHITQALLNVWFTSEPNDHDLLPAELKPLLTQLCDTRVKQYRHGRVLLASRLIAFFRVDRPWTEINLLPLFSWSSDTKEAKYAWEGFLWSPRLYAPLLNALKPDFLAAAARYEYLGEHARQYVTFLTYAALEPVPGFAEEDFRAAVEELPPEGLLQCAHALTQALEGAGDRHQEYWKNRIQPFWKNVWPKSRELVSSKISEAIARLCIAARTEFPVAITLLGGWLRPIEHPYYVMHLLVGSELCKSFPDKALILLDAIIDGRSWPPSELGPCLQLISATNPELAKDARYQRLHALSRQMLG